jgi:hypothetical protein
MVEERAIFIRTAGDRAEHLPGQRVPHLLAVVAGGVVEIAVGHLGDRQFEHVPQHPQHLGAPVGLHLRLERPGPGHRERRLAVWRGKADASRNCAFVDAGGVDDGAPRARRVAGQRRDRAGVVRLWRRRAAQLVEPQFGAVHGRLPSRGKRRVRRCPRCSGCCRRAGGGRQAAAGPGWRPLRGATGRPARGFAVRRGPRG